MFIFNDFLLEERRRVDLAVAVGEAGRLEPVTLPDGRGASGPVAAARGRLPLTVTACLPPGLRQTQCPTCCHTYRQFNQSPFRKPTSEVTIRASEAAIRNHQSP